MKGSSIHCCVTVIVFAFFFITMPLSAGEKTLQTRHFLQGIHLLEDNKPDSAVTLFVKAYSEGLSRDTLFYYWTEALISKGVLDSALATHYMISAKGEPEFRYNILRQRTHLYERLEWNNDAQAVRDSLHRHPFYRKAVLRPELDFGFNTSYLRSASNTAVVNPWNTSELPSLSNDYSGQLDIKSSWQMTRKSIAFSWGVAANTYLSMDTLSRTHFKTDSSNRSLSLFGSLTSGRKNLSVSLGYSSRSNDSSYVSASADASLIRQRSWLPSVWLGLAGDINTSSHTADTRLWLYLMSMQSRPGCSIYLSGLLNVSLSKVDSFSYLFDTLHTLYAYDARLEYPVFYTDKSYSAVIDTSLLQVITGGLKNNILASADDSLLYTGLKLPAFNISINPSLRFAFKWKLPFEIGSSWKLSYYPQQYEWDQVRISTRYIIYSKADNKFYSLPSDLLTEPVITRTASGSLLLAPTPVEGTPVTHHKKLRVDNLLAADIKLPVTLKRNSFTFLTRISKNWSTLDEQAPIEITDWSFLFALEWRLKIVNPVFTQ